MNKLDLLINKIAQQKVDFKVGCDLLVNAPEFIYTTVFNSLVNYVLNAIPDKVNYGSETYAKAIDSIPLKNTFTPVVILKSSTTKIALQKLEALPASEHSKVIISLLWIFTELDTQRRNTDCKNGCGHEWHNMF